MKNIILLVMVVLVVSCTTIQKPASDPLSQTKASNYVVADFRNIAQEHIEDYLKIEKFWKSVHQERIKDGRMTAWLLLELGICHLRLRWITAGIPKGILSFMSSGRNS